MKINWMPMRFLDPSPAEVAAQAEFMSKIQAKLDSALATRATKEELAEIRNSLPKELNDLPIEELRSMADDKTGVMATIATMGLELQRLRTQQAETTVDMSIRGQIKSWLESKNENGGTATVAETVLQLRSGNKADLKPLELDIRAAQSPMLPAGTLGGSAYLPKPEIQAGITDVIRVQPTFWDYLKKGATGSANYVWVNKKVPAGLGAAAFIAPGVYKPSISFTIDTEISYAKKIAVNEKVAIELLDDIDGMTSWVEQELLYQLKMTLTTTLIGNGAGSSTVPIGISNTGASGIAVAFAGPTLGVSTTNPNNWDVIRACVAQLKHANFGAYPVTTFMNPIDYANMVMTKAQNQGQLFIPPVTGSIIVEDNNVPIGSFICGCIDLYRILIYKGFTMVWGLENDDFTKNLRTVIGEMRIHQFSSENHKGAVIVDTFANVITGITPVAP